MKLVRYLIHDNPSRKVAYQEKTKEIKLDSNFTWYMAEEKARELEKQDTGKNVRWVVRE